MTEVQEAAAVYNWSPDIPVELEEHLLIPLPDDFEFSEEWWEWLREENRHLRIELTPSGELRLAMVSFEGSSIAVQITFQLELWIRVGGEGRTVESAAGYDLPSKFRKYPDLSWVSDERMPDVPRPWRTKLEIVPDFVVEVRSPGQSVTLQQEKMREWIDGGVRLGWLIDPFDRNVWIYRANGDVVELDNPTELSGEDVCIGLTVDMTQVWD